MRPHDSSDGWLIFTWLRPIRSIKMCGDTRLSQESPSLSATQSAAVRFLPAAHPPNPIRGSFYCRRIQIQDFLRQDANVLDGGAPDACRYGTLGRAAGWVDGLLQPNYKEEELLSLSVTVTTVLYLLLLSLTC